MAWVRVEENAIYNTKVMALSHGAFRLWHEGLAYCQRELTNGYISRAALKAFRYCTRDRVTELQTPIEDGRNPLWMPESDGFKVNDFLVYNDEREQVLKARALARERLRRLREKRAGNAVTPGVTGRVTNDAPRHVTTRHDTSHKKTPRADKPPDPAVSEFIRFFCDLHLEHFKAKYLVQGAKDGSLVKRLLGTYGLERLKLLAKVLVLTDEPWISGTDRGIGVLHMKASWLDQRLAEAEGQRAAS